MRLCPKCFSLHEELTELCPDCQMTTRSPDTPQASTSCSVLLQVTPPPIERHERSTPSGKAAHWNTAFVLLVVILVAVFTRGQCPLSNAALSTPPPAGSTALDTRQAELKEAKVALKRQFMSLESSLKESGRPPLSDSSSGIQQWTQELMRIKDAYRLWGVVDARHPDAVAEDAMRDALLYLHSMRSAVNQEGGVEGEKYQTLKKKFEDSLAMATER